MTIALIAHDSKKELMVQFCTAYCRILSQKGFRCSNLAGGWRFWSYAATDRIHDATPTHPCGIPTERGGCGK